MIHKKCQVAGERSWAYWGAVAASVASEASLDTQKVHQFDPVIINYRYITYKP